MNSFGFSYNPQMVGNYHPNGVGFGVPAHVPQNVTIKQAYVSDNNKTIILDIENDNDMSSTLYIAMTTHDGKAIVNHHNLLNDLCYILNVPNGDLAEQTGTVSVYDATSKGYIQKTAPTLIALMNKQIGMVLMDDFYVNPNKNNDVFSKKVIYALFDKETLQTPKQKYTNEQGNSQNLVALGEQAQKLSEQKKAETVSTSEQLKTQANPYASPQGQGFNANSQTPDPFYGQSQAMPMDDWR